VPVTIVGWIVFCLYTALLWPALALCLRYCRIKKVPLFLAAAVLIVGIERMQGLFLGGFLWRLLGHSQYRSITIIQIADIFGAGGVSSLIVMVNGLAAELIIAARQKNLFKITQLPKVALVCTAVIAAILYGRWRIAQSEQFIEDGPVVAALQSNVPQSVKRDFQASDELFDDLMEQSKAAAQAGAELIVWPETMVQATLNPEVLQILEPTHPWKAFDKALREHSKDTAFVLVGAYGGTPDESKMHLAQRYNSAFLYQTDGRQYEKWYDKIHLVPFGEVLPLRKTLPWLYQMLMKVKFIPYNFDYSLDYGTQYTVFEMTSPVRNSTTDKNSLQKEKISNGAGRSDRKYRFAVMICYEDVVPAIARNFALDPNGQKQLDWLVNISNDGWFVNFDDDSKEVRPSTELAQHTAICVFRAVENRLCVLRSVNTGISCLIDSLGNIKDGFLSGTLPDEAMNRTAIAGWFIDQMPIDKRVTFFSKYGEYLDFCCEICVILLIIALLSAKLLSETRKRRTGLSRRSNGKRSRKIQSK